MMQLKGELIFIMKEIKLEIDNKKIKVICEEKTTILNLIDDEISAQEIYNSLDYKKENKYKLLDLDLNNLKSTQEYQNMIPKITEIHKLYMKIINDINLINEDNVK